MFDRNDIDTRKLQPLARMEGHERHSPLRRIPTIRVAHQTHLFQEGFQCPAVREMLIDMMRIGDQFVHVLLHRMVGASDLRAWRYAT